MTRIAGPACGMNTMAEACQTPDGQIHAYWLMGNHFHLVVETPQRNLVEGMCWLQNRQAKAERLVGEELKKLEWAEDALARGRQSDPAKLAIAVRLRRETTLTLKAIALRLHLGSPKSANARLRDRGVAEAAEAITDSPRQRTEQNRKR